MSEILSQSEIDALLSALTSGEVKVEDIRDAGRTPRIRSYDFRRAMRFSQEHIRVMSRIHEHFARLLTTHLSGQLRSMVQCQVESVDQAPYEEFIRSIPALTVIQVMEFSPLEGNVVVEMNPQIVFAMLDRMMGGIASGPYKERELTEIEERLLDRIMGPTAGFFREAWRNVAELRPRFVSKESNPQFLQLTTPAETVLVVTLSAKVGETTGLMNVCIPHASIEPILPKLTTQYFMNVRKSKQGQGHAAALSVQMCEVPIQAAVQLGKAELSLRELLDIQVGDVIPLESFIDQPLLVTINNVPVMTAAIGTRQGRYAVRILDEWIGEDVGAREREALSGGN
ncbi:MAG: flagellar motor switch protein FliM [Alicyclobacillus sp.]|nr:flagellar motor switch protein FliM [Alicyclobacillus sp.]